MLSGVTVSCFIFSYLVVLATDASRFAFKVPGRNALLIGMMAAGVLAHTIFLFYQFAAVSTGGTPQLLTNWFQWAVVSAWGLSITCLILIIRNPQGSISLFLIPLILGLIGIGSLVHDKPPFARETAISLWQYLHLVSLLCGTMFVCLGMAFGVMYLVQSYRLKAKKRPSKAFRLPALEFLQSMNRFSMIASAVGLGLGMLSGIILNINREEQISWLSVDFMLPLGLFLWCAAVSTLELTSQSALGGRRTAYLNIASFALLLGVLGIILISTHGQRTLPTAVKRVGVMGESRGAVESLDARESVGIVETAGVIDVATERYRAAPRRINPQLASHEVQIAAEVNG
jgi:hypothetical protein